MASETLKLRPSSLQKAAFRLIVRERERAFVRCGRVAGPPQSRQQIGADGVKQVIAIQTQAVDQL